MYSSGTAHVCSSSSQQIAYLQARSPPIPRHKGLGLIGRGSFVQPFKAPRTPSSG